jgi:hypothetical protein
MDRTVTSDIAAMCAFFTVSMTELGKKRKRDVSDESNMYMSIPEDEYHEVQEVRGRSRVKKARLALRRDDSECAYIS